MKVENPFLKLESQKTMNVANVTQLSDRYEKLLGMDLESEEQVWDFLRKKDELDRHLINEEAECYMLKSIDVSNEEWKNRQDHFDKEIQPLKKTYENKINARFLAAPVVREMGAPINILRRNKETEKELFYQENLQLEKRVAELNNELMQLLGQQTVKVDGQEVPLAVLSPKMQDRDREVRKETFELFGQVTMADAERIDEKFNELVQLRHQIAVNAGYKNYMEYRFKEMHRYDWTPEDCKDLHRSVKKYMVPIKNKLLAIAKEQFKLDEVRPYDTRVNPYGHAPIQLFEQGESEKMVNGTEKILKAVDSELYEYFADMRSKGLFDLDIRNDKAPGGFMLMYPQYKTASIFYSCNGYSSDVMVFLHELGHCFHYYMSQHISPVALQEWTPEVAEAGSMSMEYIGLEHLGEYLDKETCERVKFDRIWHAVEIFLSCAQGDEFQHWLYENPDHTSQERRDKWFELSEIYGGDRNNEGYEERIGMVGWQYPHILTMPFYLIDYVISETLALSVWRQYKLDPAKGLASFKKGCSLGASKTVPEIYQAFGTELDFSEKVIAPIAALLEKELGF